MAVKVATAQKASVHLRMKGLDTSVTDFRESRYLADIDYLKSCILQKFHCSSGRDDFPTEIHQLTGEFYYACLITY